MDKRFLLLLLLPLLLLPAACAGEDEIAPGALLPSVTPQPTPTLAPALATVRPDLAAARHTPAVSGLGVARAKATSTPTATASPTPSPTPRPVERLELGADHLHYGNYAAAIDQYTAVLQNRSVLTDRQIGDVLYRLGVAYLRDGRFAPAVAALTEHLNRGSGVNGVAAFHLGRAYAAQEEWEAAIDAYEQFLETNPEMATYVNPYIATAHFELGDRDAAVAAYEDALAGAGYRLAEIDIRRQLADFYLAENKYDAAITQYDAIHDLAETEYTKGEMTYLAGSAALMAGDIEAAYDHYLFAVDNYPRAYESYLGLVELVDADYPVDEFQRGLVDYYAKAYQPAVAAFLRYLEGDPNPRPDARLYLAWSYEELGEIDAALTQLESYAATDPARATIERAKLLARADRSVAARDAYLAYVENFPEGEEAPFAAWWAAQWTAWLGETERAIELFQAMADRYPDHEDAPEALFRAGLLAEENGDRETAVSHWLHLTQTYPNSEYSAATLVWLLRTLPELTPTPVPTVLPTPSPKPLGEVVTAPLTATLTPSHTITLATRVRAAALANRGAGYYALRAKDIVRERLPFTPSGLEEIPSDDTLQAEADAWLRDWLQLGDDQNVRRLSPVLADDNRLIVGAKLWQMGLQAEAKRELESLRQAYADNALYSYQLALYFRDLGLYRSSIIAADTVIRLSGQTVFEAPRFIGRLAYPVYYDDLILSLAEGYGYDPLLQFALVRQESLFESFARSGAAAQGLSQVIPDTGAYIAQQLNWPDYNNEDLYKPYVGLNFGAFYLDQQLEGFDGFVAAALAAYNAGPGNAARWYEQTGADHDLYVETVTFSETRLYIERIYSGHVIYTYLYAP